MSRLFRRICFSLKEKNSKTTLPNYNHSLSSDIKVCLDPSIPQSECVPLKCKKWSSNGVSVMYNKGLDPRICHHHSKCCVSSQK